MEKVQKLLIEYRKEHNLTLKDVADKTGYSVSYISMLENGDKPMSNKMIRNITYFCKYSKDEYKNLLKAYIEDEGIISIKPFKLADDIFGLDFLTEFIITYPSITNRQFERMQKILEEK